jgi:hypothetical protein
MMPVTAGSIAPGVVPYERERVLGVQILDAKVKPISSETTSQAPVHTCSRAADRRGDIDLPLFLTPAAGSRSKSMVTEKEI